MKRLVFVLVASAAVLLVPSISGATVWTDPATLQIGTGAGTSCATPGSSGCSADPVLVGGTNFDIYQNSAGAPTLSNPVLLILGIPNDTTNLFGSNPITKDQFINTYPGGALSNGSSAMLGFFGSMGAGQEVYSFLGLQGPTDNSNSFTNWSGAAQADAGVTATNYGIYVFALSDASSPLAEHGLINITFGSALPAGAMIVAYGEFASGHQIYDTPFTEAGMSTGTTGITSVPVPEPASLMLLGSGLLVVSAKIRRRRGSR